jgi:hypothetical protein
MTLLIDAHRMRRDGSEVSEYLFELFEGEVLGGIEAKGFAEGGFAGDGRQTYHLVVLPVLAEVELAQIIDEHVIGLP